MFFSWFENRKVTAIDGAKAKIQKLVDQRLGVLARKRVKGIKIDAKGKIDATTWANECQNFLDEVILPTLSQEEIKALLKAGLSKIATQLIDEPVRKECLRLNLVVENDMTSPKPRQQSGDNKGQVKVKASSSAKKASQTVAAKPSANSGNSQISYAGRAVVSNNSQGRGEITRGLIIRPEPLDKILSGSKTWEMRGRNINIRGPIALIGKGSKAIYGVAHVVDSIGPLTRTEMINNQSKHRITPERMDHPDVANYRYAWVLSNVRRLEKPIPYVHNGGAVQFVSLDDTAIRLLMEAI